MPVILFGLILIFALVAGCSSVKEKADTILINGKIITVDKDFSFAEAVAIKEGKVLATGKNKDILKLKGDSTNIIDLKGHTVIPGLIEGHAHPSRHRKANTLKRYRTCILSGTSWNGSVMKPG
jgi:adenine deaminase